MVLGTLAHQTYHQLLKGQNSALLDFLSHFRYPVKKEINAFQSWIYYYRSCAQFPNKLYKKQAGKIPACYV